MAVIKLSSSGHGRGFVRANLRYISRGDYVLKDETGRAINIKDALLKYEMGREVTDFRMIVTLPVTGTDRAREIVQEVVCGKYRNFVQAEHLDPANPHIHFNLANYKNHPLSQWKSIDREIKPLSFLIDERFLAEGISYNFKKDSGLRAIKTQCEYHREEKGLKNWKDEMRTAIKTALKNCKDFNSFEKALKKSGIEISRETDRTLTFQNAEGKKCRLNRLFSSLKNREDVERRISENKERREIKADKEGAKFISSFLSKNSSSESQNSFQPSTPGLEGQGYEAGDEGIEERMSEDEKAAIRYRNRQRRIAAGQQVQASSIGEAGPSASWASFLDKARIGENKELKLQFKEEKAELKLLSKEEKEIKRIEEQKRLENEIEEDLAERARAEEEIRIKKEEEEEAFKRLDEAYKNLEETKNTVKERAAEQIADDSIKMFEEAGNINKLVKDNAELTNAVQARQKPLSARERMQQAAQRVAARQPVFNNSDPGMRPGR